MTQQYAAQPAEQIGAEVLADFARCGASFLAADRTNAALELYASDWARFGANWDELTLDTYMADGGTYRYRRFGQYDYDRTTDELDLLPHGPYQQALDINPLNGGVERWFDPLTPEFVSDPLLTGLLRQLGRWYAELENHPRWNIKLHPYRIIAAAEAAGQPAPEGRHRDGVTYIHSLMITRLNVRGGTSTVYSNEGALLDTQTLTEPGDLLLGDDRSTLHAVTPVEAINEDHAAYRDVLVIAFTRRD